jgi:hypothetical protein
MHHRARTRFIRNPFASETVRQNIGNTHHANGADEVGSVLDMNGLEPRAAADRLSGL